MIGSNENKKPKAVSRSMRWWLDLTAGFTTIGGNLVLLFLLIVLLMPFLWQNNPKAWEALTFIMGVIAGLVRGVGQMNDSDEKRREDGGN